MPEVGRFVNSATNRAFANETTLMQLRRYAKALRKEGQLEAMHKSSAVTSMHEDIEIAHIGEEKVKIAERLLHILDTGGSR